MADPNCNLDSNGGGFGYCLPARWADAAKFPMPGRNFWRKGRTEICGFSQTKIRLPRHPSLFLLLRQHSHIISRDLNIHRLTVSVEGILICPVKWHCLSCPRVIHDKDDLLPTLLTHRHFDTRGNFIVQCYRALSGSPR